MEKKHCRNQKKRKGQQTTIFSLREIHPLWKGSIANWITNIKSKQKMNEAAQRSTIASICNISLVL